MVNQSVFRNTPLESRLEGNDAITAETLIALVITSFSVVGVLVISGYVLVVVYARKMKTSIRVYMFALAVANLALCTNVRS